MDTIHLGGLNKCPHIRFFADQPVINSRRVVGADAYTRGQGTLRVKIDQKHIPAVFGQCSRQRNGGSGFTHPAFLVTQGNHSGGPMRSEGRWLVKFAHRPPGGTHLCAVFCHETSLSRAYDLARGWEV